MNEHVIKHDQLTKYQQEVPASQPPQSLYAPLHGGRVRGIRLCPPVRSRYLHVEIDKRWVDSWYVPEMINS